MCIYYTYQLYLYLTCAYRHVYAYTLIAVATYFAVYDADGDTVQCRSATGTECGCVCEVFSIATLQVGDHTISSFVETFAFYRLWPEKACNSGTLLLWKTLKYTFSAPFVSATLMQENCSLTYNGGGSLGYYAVALQVEDFTSESPRVVMSSVPVQFLVEVVNVTNPLKPPTFVGSTPSSGDCISVAIGSTYQTQITAKSGGENAT